MDAVKEEEADGCGGFFLGIVIFMGACDGCACGFLGIFHPESNDLFGLRSIMKESLQESYEERTVRNILFKVVAHHSADAPIIDTVRQRCHLLTISEDP